MFTDIGDTLGSVVVRCLKCLSRRGHDVDDSQLCPDPGAPDMVPARRAARGSMGLLETGDLPQDVLQVAGAISSGWRQLAQPPRPVAAAPAQPAPAVREGGGADPGDSPGARVRATLGELLPAARGGPHRESGGRLQGLETGRPGAALSHPQAVPATVHFAV